MRAWAYLLPISVLAFFLRGNELFDAKGVPAAVSPTNECDRLKLQHALGAPTMLLVILRILFAFVCAGVIARYVSFPGDSTPDVIHDEPFLCFVVLMVVTQSFTFVDWMFRRKSVQVISAVYFGLLIGVLMAYLLTLALNPMLAESPYRDGLVMIITLVLPYLSISLIMQTKDDFRFIIPYVEFSRELKGGTPWIMDTSALIDGRIADVVDTHVVDAQMVVPEFVLHEVQDIADSNDKMRRTRGRRGLDVLSKLQNNPNADVRVHETKKDEFKGMSVDRRLVALAKQIGGRVVTNDFNLNKVASVQGIYVINLNDVANALRPRYLPGERLMIKIVKEGETQGQGVGYLDDGTMVVCEQASHLVGKDLDVIVTSVLQTSAGRMIFVRQTQSTD